MRLFSDLFDVFLSPPSGRTPVGRRAVGRRAALPLAVPLLSGLTVLAAAPGAAASQAATSRPTASQPAASQPDTGLVAAVRRGILRASPELAARRAALAAAAARLRATGFAAPAVLSAEAENVPQGLDLANAYSLRVDVGRELFASTRRSAARALAESERRATAVALEIAERRVVALGDRALIQAFGWVAVARRLAEEDALLGSAEGSVRARFTVGDARYVDVLRLRTERLRVQTDRAAAVTEARAGRRALEGLLGEDTAAVAAVAALVDAAAPAGPPSTGAPSAGAPSPSVIRSASLAGGTDLVAMALPPAPSLDSLLALAGAVRAADAAVARAQAQQRLTRAEQRPVVTAGLGVQRFLDAQNRYVVGPTLGASVSLPFTAAGAVRTATAAAAADVAAAEAERRAALAGARAALGAARDRYEAARERLAVYDAALLRGAREERESALAAYRTADLSLLELIDFERALSRAEIDRLRARIEAADALAALLSGDADLPASPLTRTSDDR